MKLVFINLSILFKNKLFKFILIPNHKGEALGAIGSPESVAVLEAFSKDPIPEVAETCQLALERINWLLDEKKKSEIDNAYKQNPYCSVDPTPSISLKDTVALRNMLLDEDVPLFERYRAMFALRNKGDDDSVKALAEGINSTHIFIIHLSLYVTSLFY